METLKPHIESAKLLSRRLTAGMAAASLMLGPAAPAVAEVHAPAAADHGIPGHAAKKQGRESDELWGDKPHIIFGEEDANPPRFDSSDEYIKDRVSFMTDTMVRMNAQVRRVKIDPLRALHNRSADWRVYDEQFSQAKENGLDMYVTLSTRGVDWTRGKLTRALNAIILRYPEQVAYMSTSNESNYHPEGPKYRHYTNYELRAMDGLTVPQTAHVLNVITQQTLRKLAPDTKFVVGEILGEASVEPERFLREMLEPVPGMRDDEPLRPDAIGIHNYALLHDPSEPAPKGAWAINSFEEIEGVLDDLQKSGRLQTPDGGKVPIYVSEHTWNVNDPTRDQVESPRYWEDSDRKAFFRTAWRNICADPNVKMYILYGPLPAPDWWEGKFHVQVIGANGRPMGSFYIFKKTLENHPECVE